MPACSQVAEKGSKCVKQSNFDRHEKIEKAKLSTQLVTRMTNNNMYVELDKLSFATFSTRNAWAHMKDT
jgi:hypothetical protein